MEEADPYPEGKNRRDLDQHRGGSGIDGDPHYIVCSVVDPDPARMGIRKYSVSGSKSHGENNELKGG